MYTVKVLSEKDFDKLPYKKARTSLGLADAKNGVAYVRDTGYNDVTKQTINHELDELVAKTSPHEEDGIRYKNMGGLASMGGGAGAGLLGNAVSGKFGKIGDFLGKASPFLAAGAGAALNKDNRFGGAMQGLFGGGIGSGLGQGFSNFTSPGGTFGKAMDGFGQGRDSFIGQLPFMKGYKTDNPQGAMAKFLSGGQASGGDASSPSSSLGGYKPLSLGEGNDSISQILGSTGSNLSVGGESAPVMSAFKPQAGSNFGKSILDMIAPQGGGGSAQTQTSTGGGDAGGGILEALFGKGEEGQQKMMGMALPLLGNMFAPKAEAPNFGGITDQLRGQMESGGNPFARELGMAELTRGLQSELGTVPENAFSLGDSNNEESKQKALQALTNQWKNIRPGADFSNDAEFQRQYQDIVSQYDDQRTMQRDQQQFSYNTQQLQQKQAYMQQALQLDQYQMQQLVQLAQMDVNSLMLQYGLDVGEAQQFKQLFGDLGQLQMQSVNQDQSFDIQGIMDMFKGGQ